MMELTEMKYKKIFISLLAISILFLLLALIIFKDISFLLIGLSIVLIGIDLMILISTKTFK